MILCEWGPILNENTFVKKKIRVKTLNYLMELKWTQFAQIKNFGIKIARLIN